MTSLLKILSCGSVGCLLLVLLPYELFRLALRRELRRRAAGLVALALLLCAGSARATTVTNALGFLVPTNLSPSVTLAWDPSTNSGVISYRIYYGVASRGYTNNATVSTSNSVLVTLPARGATYYFAAAAQDTNGLESDFSNEVSWTVPAAPSAPFLHNVVRLTAQSTPDLAVPWWDDVFEVVISEDLARQFFRLRIAQQ